MNNRDLLDAYMDAIESRECASSSQQYDELTEEVGRLYEAILDRMVEEVNVNKEEETEEKSGVDEYEEMYCDTCGGTACHC